MFCILYKKKIQSVGLREYRLLRFECPLGKYDRGNKFLFSYGKNHTTHINTLCGQNAEIFNVKTGGIHTNH
jgi:hypothetical protein